MNTTVHPAVPHHQPFFLPGPDGSDPVLIGTGIFLLIAVTAFGILFLRLHTMPERLAHRGHKMQFEIVAVLGLISLFTHMHIFWIIGLLLALIDLPDLTGPMRRIAGSTEKMAGLPPGHGDTAPEKVPAEDAASPDPLIREAPSKPPLIPETAHKRHEA